MATAAPRSVEDAVVEALPRGERYESSYMHRDTVTHVVVAPYTEFVATASKDGHVKLWKKMRFGIEFVKHYHAHAGEVHCLCVSADGLWLCSTGGDGSAKLYDVPSFDMARILKLTFIPGEAAWISKRGSPKAVLCVAEMDQPGPFRFYASPDFLQQKSQLRVHSYPVRAVAYVEPLDLVISADSKGFIEYWRPPHNDDSSEESSESSWGGKQNKDSKKKKIHEDLTFSHKVETDLYALAKSKTEPVSLATTNDDRLFAVCSTDGRLRIFDVKSGKLLRTVDVDEAASAAREEEEEAEAGKKEDQKDADSSEDDEGPACSEAQEQERERKRRRTLKGDLSYERRVAVEKEARGTPWNCAFDDSGRYVLFGSSFGIKVVDVSTGATRLLIGESDSLAERFRNVALFQGAAKVDAQMEQARATEAPTTTSSTQPASDPTIFATSFKRKRFYLLTRREPTDQEKRDVLNERPDPRDRLTAASSSGRRGAFQKGASSKAVLRTTLGDVTLSLFPEECPKTVENFVTHAKNGYYDNLVFHRVIKSFMVQTGDPNGDGTGGESIWGHDFEDEFSPTLKHDRPFTLSMANAGPNTNGMFLLVRTHHMNDHRFPVLHHDDALPLARREAYDLRPHYRRHGHRHRH